MSNLIKNNYPKFELHKRFCQSKDFVPLIKLISLANMDKIPFIANIIKCTLDSTVDDKRLVKFILELKSNISIDSPKLSPSSSGSEYIFFLSAFNSFNDQSMHSMTNQTTIFHLSECLTIINSYKTIAQRKLLLIQKEQTKNNQTVISSIELPSLEVTAVLNILSFILKSSVTMKLKIMSDVLLSALRIFYKIALHPFCTSSVKKAYIALVVNLMDPSLKVHGTIEPLIETELKGTLVTFMKKYNGKALSDGNIQFISFGFDIPADA